MSLVPRSGPHRASPSEWIVITLAAIATPVFLYLIVRTAVIGLQPVAAASLPPTDYTRVLRRVIPAFINPRVPVPDQIVEIANSAAVTQPLSYEPYFALSRKAFDEGDLDRAISLMEESRRRRPNYLPTRLMLMFYYSQAQRHTEALAEMEYGMRSSEGMRKLVIPHLVQATRDVEGRRALAYVLARAPEWRGEFFRAAQEGGLAPEEARDLLELVRARRPDGDLSLERGLYVQTLVRRGRVEEARATWLQSFSDPDRVRYKYLFDGDFSGRDAPPPFGWMLNDMDVGRAEIIRSEGRNSRLEVNYFGGKTATLAEQVLALPAGEYQFSFDARSDSGISSGGLRWSLSCFPEGPELAQAKVTSPQSTYRKYQAELRVPTSGCTGQRLRLIAEAGDVASAYTVGIDNIQMVRR